MARPQTIFTCQQCGYRSPGWLGRCPQCQSWNSFDESKVSSDGSDGPPGRGWEIGEDASPKPISEIDAAKEPRMRSGLAEFDRVCGGGLVPGSVLLIGGDPGVGKSTLALQVLGKLADNGFNVLYVTGEESARQVKRRADRLGTLNGKLLVAALTDLGQIMKAADKLKPSVLVVDSIQTTYSTDLTSAPGSVSQVRESASRLMAMSKRRSMTGILIGHVTKDGAIAGPRVLEHMVDAVLTFEGEHGHAFRILRAVKNRFGSTNEVGVFEMTRNGLAQVDDPSRIFLAERPQGEPGSVVTVTVEGTRPLLVEIQALVSPATFGTPRRTCLGIDPNRVALLAAVLEKKAGLDLIGCDIFVNAAGGARLTEPAIDLGIACALASSLIDRPLPSQTVLFGEIGLAGELRQVTQPALRLAEAAKMGFIHALSPLLDNKIETPPKMTVTGLRRIGDAIESLF